jgi:glucosamine--fructose-6-phosphate aminotransferase (isomerizing)
LKAQGYVFASETDTEVIAHLIHSRLTGSTAKPRVGATAVSPGGLMAAVASAVSELEGAYAIAVITTAEPDTVVGSRRVPPYCWGLVNQHRARISSV